MGSYEEVYEEIKFHSMNFVKVVPARKSGETTLALMTSLLRRQVIKLLRSMDLNIYAKRNGPEYIWTLADMQKKLIDL